MAARLGSADVSSSADATDSEENLPPAGAQVTETQVATDVAESTTHDSSSRIQNTVAFKPTSYLNDIISTINEQTSARPWLLYPDEEDDKVAQQHRREEQRLSEQ